MNNKTKLPSISPIGMSNPTNLPTVYLYLSIAKAGALMAHCVDVYPFETANNIIFKNLIQSEMSSLKIIIMIELTTVLIYLLRKSFMQQHRCSSPFKRFSSTSGAIVSAWQPYRVWDRSISAGGRCSPRVGPSKLHWTILYRAALVVRLTLSYRYWASRVLSA